MKISRYYKTLHHDFLLSCFTTMCIVKRTIQIIRLVFGNILQATFIHSLEAIGAVQLVVIFVLALGGNSM